MSKKLDPKVTEQVMLRAGFKPLEPYKSALSNWKCIHVLCGKTVYPRYNSIQQGRGGCLACGYKQSGMKSRLSKTELNQRLKLKKLKLIGEYTTAEKPLRIKCLLCNNYSEAILDSLLKKNRGEGCEKCRRKNAGTLSNEVVVKEMLVKGLKPLENYKGYKNPWLCKCLTCKKNKRISRETVRRRSIEFQGCIECAKKMQNNKRIQQSRESVLKRFAAKNLKLISEYKSASLPIKVRCLNCSHEFDAYGAQINRQKYACAKCAGNYVDPIEANKFMVTRGFIPYNKFPGAHKPWKSIHKLCGKEASPSYTTIKNGFGGCKYCANHGFKYSKSAYLYLITNAKLNSHKIGIANPAKIKKSDRLHRYQFHGWEICRIWNFSDGKKAELIENRVLIELRVERDIPIHLTKSEMSGQGGHTETMSADSITLLEIEKIIKKVIKGYRQ